MLFVKLATLTTVYSVVESTGNASMTFIIMDIRTFTSSGRRAAVAPTKLFS